MGRTLKFLKEVLEAVQDQHAENAAMKRQADGADGTSYDTNGQPRCPRGHLMASVSSLGYKCHSCGPDAVLVPRDQIGGAKKKKK